jgi:excisionase family DNA binding protein
MRSDTVESITLSAAAAGRLLGLGKAATLRLIHSGQIPAVRLGKRIRVRRADIDAFLAELPPVAEAGAAFLAAAGASNAALDVVRASAAKARAAS